MDIKSQRAVDHVQRTLSTCLRGHVLFLTARRAPIDIIAEGGALVLAPQRRRVANQPGWVSAATLALRRRMVATACQGLCALRAIRPAFLAWSRSNGS